MPSLIRFQFIHVPTADHTKTMNTNTRMMKEVLFGRRGGGIAFSCIDNTPAASAIGVKIWGNNEPLCTEYFVIRMSVTYK